MLIRVDTGSEQALYEQIAAQVRRAIARGKVQRGEQLPSARELAESLGVNMHTVLRAYGALRDEGLVDMRRGRGVTVRGPAAGRARLNELALALLEEGRRQGLRVQELARLLRELS